MVKEIKLYVEGGGKGSHKNATIRLQQGFDAFFKTLKDAARDKKISFKIIPSSDTQATYEDFMRSVENSPDSFNLLLVDSDEEVDKEPRAFLQNKHKKWKLQNVKDEQCHLMVQIMESWFLADKEKLAEFYGKNFNLKKLSRHPNVEKILKTDVANGLREATKNTQKGEYHKIRHGGKILEKISPQNVCNSARNCKRIFDIISEEINQK